MNQSFPPIFSVLPDFSASQILWILFYAAALATFITTLAFYYHWGRFSPSHFGAILTIVVYTTGIAVLFMGMLGILSTL